MNKTRTDSLDDILMFDGRFYHEKCFFKMKAIKKKCAHCHKDIAIPNNLKECILYDNRYYHFDCFLEECHDRNTAKWKNALSCIDDYKAEAEGALLLLLEQRRFDKKSIDQYKNDAMVAAEKWFAEADVNAFIRECYGVQNVPWTRLAQVYNGTFRKGVMPIPASHLFEMWKKKMPFLKKIYQKNILQGKQFEPEQRIIYDLAILVGKYDSFLKWKKEQTILASQVKVIKASNNLTPNLHFQNQIDAGSYDAEINHIVDDIFE